MDAKILWSIGWIVLAGCSADIGEACGEDASSVAHASVLCEEGSICEEGICVESRKEGERCVVGEKSYACDGENIACDYSMKRGSFICIAPKEIGEFCDTTDGHPKGCLGFPECKGDELWPPNVPTLNFRGVCDSAVHCINGLCQKSKNKGSKCYIADEHSCLELFNCIPSDVSIQTPISESTLNSINRTNGICSPLSQVDEPCDPANYIKCADGLTCNTNNVCEEIR